MTRRKTAIALAVVLLALCGRPTAAQWLNYRAKGTPRTPDGKVNLTARAPRAPDGKPDLSGIWRAEPTPVEELKRLIGDVDTLSVPGDDARTFSKYLFNVLGDFQPGEEPMRPEAAEIFKQRAPDAGKDFPTGHCLPAGVPTGLLIPIPFKIIQTPGLTVILFEGDNTIRQIYTDGRTHPTEPHPLWLGYSIGRWQGDTLVVDTVGFNDKSWLDPAGHPHSDALHVVERFRRRDFGHIDVEATMDDPKMYTKPFTIKFALLLQPDTDILESFCAENEKDRAHLAGR
jgi:hypothetical protein